MRSRWMVMGLMLLGCTQELSAIDEQDTLADTQFDPASVEDISGGGHFLSFLERSSQERRDSGRYASDKLDFLEAEGYRTFEFVIEQPLSHADPASETFLQRGVLHHRSSDAPIVLSITGYGLLGSLSEMTETFYANELQVEDRFFGESFPEDLEPEDWKFHTLEEHASDNHRVVELLKPFYRSAWISTGISQGGTLSTLHRYFYPSDVDLTVATVAPFSSQRVDPRTTRFLDHEVGTEACRKKVQRVQRRILENADVIQPLEAAEAAESGYTYERYGGHYPAWENLVMFMDFYFWMFSGPTDCEDFNDPDRLSVEELRGLLFSHTYYSDYNDAYIESRVASDYMAASETGLGAPSSHLRDILRYENYAETTDAWLPRGVRNLSFKPQTMHAVQDWVKHDAEGMVFIYGEYDPMTAVAIDVGANANVRKITLAEQNHTARITTIRDTEQNESVASYIGEVLAF